MEVKTEEKITADRLEKLGLKAVARNLVELKERKKKMMIAYEHYRYLTPEKIQAFQEKLERETRRKSQGMGYSVKRLSFVPLGDYAKVPPEDVLQKLEEAIERNCFDQFEVAHIEEVKIDPLLLGKINGCADKFFIGQWDNDVKIEDILKANEG